MEEAQDGECIPSCSAFMGCLASTLCCLYSEFVHQHFTGRNIAIALPGPLSSWLASSQSQDP